MARILKKDLRIACVQLASGLDKEVNLSAARHKVLKAANAGAKVVVLPECFNSPYGTSFFPKYAEILHPSPPTQEQAPSFYALSFMAREAQVFLVGGSIPEVDAGKYYNTCLVFSPAGLLLASHRKTHLFNIDIPGQFSFRESDILSPGQKLTVVDLPEYGRLAVGICYDIRFPEVAMIAARQGCFAIIYPAAFPIVTGQLHWSLLAGARAVDNQFYVAMCSPARQENATYVAWGHSIILDPMAKILDEAEEKECIIYGDLREEAILTTRRNIPIYSQRRFDLYPDVSNRELP